MKTHIILLSLVMVIIFGCGPKGYKITPIPASDELRETTVAKDKGIFLPKIALIDIDGLIINQRSTSLLSSGENPMALILEKLQRAEMDDSVKAIVLRINSPGGSVTATDIIYRKIKGISEVKKKPIVASMTDVAASGGYYIACAADEIFAEPTTVTGSIGVVMQTFTLKDMLDKIGVQTDAIKSGPKKDAGSPFRPMKPEERKLFQDMINQFYERFLSVVSSERKRDKKYIRNLADGRVFTGQNAQKLGLIDKLGGLNDALIQAKKLAKIDKAKVVIYHRPVGYRGSIYASTDIPHVKLQQKSVINLQLPLHLQNQGAFLYLWQP